MPASEFRAAPPRPGRRDLAVICALSVAHALLVILAWPPVAAWPLVVLVPAPLIWLALEARDGRMALLAVGVTQWATWLWVERWLVDVTGLGYVLFGFYMALYPVLFVYVVRRVARHPALSRLPMALVAAVLWVGLECLRGKVVMHGYPWFLLGHPLIGLPVLCQSADLLGVALPSALVAAASGAIVDLVRRRRRALLPAAIVGSLLVADIAYGAWRLGQQAPLRPGPRVLVVQTDLPQSNKMTWGPEAQARDVPRFIEQTVAAFDACDPPPDLVVWPETMVPGAGFERDTLELLRSLGPRLEPLVVWVDRIEALRHELDVPFLVGTIAWVGPSVDEEGRAGFADEYNSVYLLDGSAAPQRYDKVVLTPFGETMPYISAWPWLEDRLTSIAARGMTFSLSVGDAVRRLTLERGAAPVRLATPICFEVTVAPLCRRMVYATGGKAADVLVNLSNDGWFGGSDAGRRRHLQIARFRCIENRVPMVRAVNTGVSASIDSCGRLVQAGPARAPGAVLAEPPLDARTTVYGRTGDLLYWLALAGTVGLVAMTFKGRR